MKENSIEKTLENIQNVDLITLLRKFKKEGVENFIVIRRNDFDEILSDYKRVLKENEELKKFHIQDNKHLDFIMKNSITVQKIKDKIEYLDKQQKQWLEDRELKASDSEIIFARNFLQELLKESEK